MLFRSCVGPIFVLLELFSYVRAANLVLHKLPDPPSFFPFSTKRSVPYRCVYWVTPFFPFRPTKWLDSQSILLSLPPFLIEPRPRLTLHPTHPSFLFEPRPRFDYRSKKINMQLEQRRFQRNLYLRVVGMWQGVRREAEIGRASCRERV